MCDGEVKAKKKNKPTAATKRDAFDKYLKIFYDRPKIEVHVLRFIQKLTNIFICFIVFVIKKHS